MTGPAPAGARRRLPWIALGVLLVVTVVVGVAFASRFGQDVTLHASPLIGQAAPPIRLDTLDGEPFDSADRAGDVLVVNFWASWCFPCRTEHPALVTAADAYRDLGVTFIGVLHDDTVANGLAFLDELGWSDEFVYVDDRDFRASIDYGVFGIPETFFVDRSGTVVGVVRQAISLELLSGTLDAILLGGS